MNGFSPRKAAKSFMGEEFGGQTSLSTFLLDRLHPVDLLFLQSAEDQRPQAQSIAVTAIHANYNQCRVRDKDE